MKIYETEMSIPTYFLKKSQDYCCWKGVCKHCAEIIWLIHYFNINKAVTERKILVSRLSYIVHYIIYVICIYEIKLFVSLNNDKMLNKQGV